jgi:excisionase family DNA binding protein
LIGRPKDPDIISVSEAASVLGVKNDTVKRWCQEGRLPAIKRGWRWWVKQDAMQSMVHERVTSDNSSELLMAGGSDGHLAPEDIRNSATGSVDEATVLDSIQTLSEGVREVPKEEAG